MTLTTQSTPVAAAEPPQTPSRHSGSVCPNCGAPSVHRSHRKGLTERLFVVVGASIRRCHACNVRFARLFTSAIYMDDASRAIRRAALLMLMLAGALLVIIAMLWFMNKQAAIGPSDCRMEPRPAVFPHFWALENERAMARGCTRSPIST